MTYDEANAKCKQLADAKFLAKLTEIWKLYAWRGDYVEIRAFIETLHEDAGIAVPDLDPYDFEDDDDPDEEDVLDENCPVCGHEYDEIDYDYQICHRCHHNNLRVSHDQKEIGT